MIKTDECVWITFRNKKFACTGFSKEEERILATNITLLGGKFQNAVSNATNYLIVNTKRVLTPSNKYIKALRLREYGILSNASWEKSQIHIISYSDYLRYKGVNYLNGREDDYAHIMPDLIRLHNTFSGKLEIHTVTWHDNTFGWLDDHVVLVSISNSNSICNVYLYGDGRTDIDVGDYSQQHCEQDHQEKCGTHQTIDDTIDTLRRFIGGELCTVACFSGDTPIYTDPVRLVNSSDALNSTRDQLLRLTCGENSNVAHKKHKVRVCFWNQMHNFAL